MTGHGRRNTETGAPEGVEPLDHTADVGYDVTAGTLEELFGRAAVGAVWLALGCLPPEGSEVRRLELEGESLAGLLRAWLREVLFWQEVEGFALSEVSDIEIEPEGARLEARVLGGPPLEDPEREIKGVTWHGLAVQATPDGWTARIIFDV
jgi:SHS2 domain-containing protein